MSKRMDMLIRQGFLGLALLVVLTVGLAACGGATYDESESTSETVEVGDEPSEAGEEAAEEEAMSDNVEAVGSGEDDGSPFDPSNGPKTTAGSDSTPSAAESSNDDPARVPGNTAVGEDDLDMPLGQNQPLTLIVKDDNVDWLAYQSDLAEATGTTILPVMPRYLLTMRDTAGQLVSGAAITLRRGVDPVTALRTHGDGTAVFYAGLFPSDSPTLLTANDMPLPTTNTSSQHQLTITATNPAPVPTRVPLDVVVLLDINQIDPAVWPHLRDNITQMLNYYDNQPTGVDLRVTVISGESNALPWGTLTPSELAPRAPQTVPTAVWLADSADRLLLWVTDAPPTQPDADLITKLQTQGVRLYPLLLTTPTAVQDIAVRQMAQMTGGQTLVRPTTQAEVSEAAVAGRFPLAPLNSWLIDTVRYTAVGE